ncbi:CPBP family intramembrane glutamic endopeptidase [Mucilaginibacter sabulilitoris]|uniref:CPBP family intramembrane glutamic endopeptidase n=1 Tax=Mucilaginibacter sabulilitoris TaxID=1173583 RepID=A0ABZ0TRQ9_9SPHI|nr:CPBP family intramembrane glutamic endopeptidase [Mucilaginibacter sabulilitoris]WPU94459.1 CPBP family intramembrane glutamic endopeptidase [Mucilaginibacter sabulilitoris]
MIQEPIEQYKAQPTQTHPSIQIIILVAGTIFALIVFGLLAAGIIWAIYGTQTVTDVMSFNTANKNTLSGLWILQIVSTTLPLFVVPVLFARFIVHDTPKYLKTNFQFPSILLLLVFAIMLFSSPVMEVLTNINQKLTLPDSLKAVEDAMRAMEQQAQKATTVMLTMNSVGSMLWAVFVVGLLTAIAEEFLFRGCLQTIFIKWTKNTHAAIWITAILFSTFHMEFFSFLPRVALGVFFGYFVAWSGSVWTGVWAHFLNNGSAVVITYLYQHKSISLNPDDQHVFNYSSYAFSLIIILILLYIYRNIALRKPMFNY